MTAAAAATTTAATLPPDDSADVTRPGTGVFVDTTHSRALCVRHADGDQPATQQRQQQQQRSHVTLPALSAMRRVGKHDMHTTTATTTRRRTTTAAALRMCNRPEHVQLSLSQLQHIKALFEVYDFVTQGVLQRSGLDKCSSSSNTMVTHNNNSYSSHNNSYSTHGGGGCDRAASVAAPADGGGRVDASSKRSSLRSLRGNASRTTALTRGERGTGVATTLLLPPLPALRPVGGSSSGGSGGMTADAVDAQTLRDRIFGILPRRHMRRRHSTDSSDDDDDTSTSSDNTSSSSDGDAVRSSSSSTAAIVSATTPRPSADDDDEALRRDRAVVAAQLRLLHEWRRVQQMRTGTNVAGNSSSNNNATTTVDATRDAHAAVVLPSSAGVHLAYFTRHIVAPYFVSFFPVQQQQQQQTTMTTTSADTDDDKTTTSSSASAAAFSPRRRSHVRAVRRLFRVMDTNGDGRVSWDEFADYVLQAGQRHLLERERRQGHAHTTTTSAGNSRHATTHTRGDASSPPQQHEAAVWSHALRFAATPVNCNVWQAQYPLVRHLYHRSAVHRLVVSTRSRRYFTAGVDGLVKMWRNARKLCDAHGRASIVHERNVLSVRAPITDMARAPASLGGAEVVAVAAMDGTVTLLRTATGEVVRTLLGVRRAHGHTATTTTTTTTMTTARPHRGDKSAHDANDDDKDHDNTSDGDDDALARRARTLGHVVLRTPYTVRAYHADALEIFFGRTNRFFHGLDVVAPTYEHLKRAVATPCDLLYRYGEDDDDDENNDEDDSRDGDDATTAVVPRRRARRRHAALRRHTRRDATHAYATALALAAYTPSSAHTTLARGVYLVLGFDTGLVQLYALDGHWFAITHVSATRVQPPCSRRPAFAARLHAAPVTHVFVSASAELLLTASEDATVVVRSLAQLAVPLLRLGDGVVARATMTTTTSTLLRDRHGSGSSRPWRHHGQPHDVASALHEHVGHTKRITCACWNEQHHLLVTGGLDHCLYYWSARTSRPLRKTDLRTLHERSSSSSSGSSATLAGACGYAIHLAFMQRRAHDTYARADDDDDDDTYNTHSNNAAVEPLRLIVLDNRRVLRIVLALTGELVCVLRDHSAPSRALGDLLVAAYDVEADRLLLGGVCVRAWEREVAQRYSAEYTGHRQAVVYVDDNAALRVYATADATRVVLWTLTMQPNAVALRRRARRWRTHAQRRARACEAAVQQDVRLLVQQQQQHQGSSREDAVGSDADEVAWRQHDARLTRTAVDDVNAYNHTYWCAHTRVLRAWDVDDGVRAVVMERSDAHHTRRADTDDDDKHDGGCRGGGGGSSLFVALQRRPVIVQYNCYNGVALRYMAYPTTVPTTTAVTMTPARPRRRRADDVTHTTSPAATGADVAYDLLGLCAGAACVHRGEALPTPLLCVAFETTTSAAHDSSEQSSSSTSGGGVVAMYYLNEHATHMPPLVATTTTATATATTSAAAALPPGTLHPHRCVVVHDGAAASVALSRTRGIAVIGGHERLCVTPVAESTQHATSCTTLNEQNNNNNNNNNNSNNRDGSGSDGQATRRRHTRKHTTTTATVDVAARPLVALYPGRLVHAPATMRDMRTCDYTTTTTTTGNNDDYNSSSSATTFLAHAFDAMRSYIGHVCVLGDTDYVVSGSNEGVVQIWHSHTACEVLRFVATLGGDAITALTLRTVTSSDCHHSSSCARAATRHARRKHGNNNNDNDDSDSARAAHDGGDVYLLALGDQSGHVVLLTLRDVATWGDGLTTTATTTMTSAYAKTATATITVLDRWRAHGQDVRGVCIAAHVDVDGADVVGWDYGDVTVATHARVAHTHATAAATAATATTTSVDAFATPIATLVTASEDGYVYVWRWERGSVSCLGCFGGGPHTRVQPPLLHMPPHVLQCYEAARRDYVLQRLVRECHLFVVAPVMASSTLQRRHASPPQRPAERDDRAGNDGDGGSGDDKHDNDDATTRDWPTHGELCAALAVMRADVQRLQQHDDAAWVLATWGSYACSTQRQQQRNRNHESSSSNDDDEGSDVDDASDDDDVRDNIFDVAGLHHLQLLLHSDDSDDGDNDDSDNDDTTSQEQQQQQQRLPPPHVPSRQRLRTLPWRTTPQQQQLPPLSSSSSSSLSPHAVHVLSFMRGLHRDSGVYACLRRTIVALQPELAAYNEQQPQQQQLVRNASMPPPHRGTRSGSMLLQIQHSRHDSSSNSVSSSSSTDDVSAAATRSSDASVDDSGIQRRRRSSSNSRSGSALVVVDDVRRHTTTRPSHFAATPLHDTTMTTTTASSPSQRASPSPSAVRANAHDDDDADKSSSNSTTAPPLLAATTTPTTTTRSATTTLTTARPLPLSSGSVATQLTDKNSSRSNDNKNDNALVAHDDSDAEDGVGGGGGGVDGDDDDVATVMQRAYMRRRRHEALAQLLADAKRAAKSQRTRHAKHTARHARRASVASARHAMMRALEHGLIGLATYRDFAVTATSGALYGAEQVLLRAHARERVGGVATSILRRVFGDAATTTTVTTTTRRHGRRNRNDADAPHSDDVNNNDNNNNENSENVNADEEVDWYTARERRRRQRTRDAATWSASRVMRTLLAWHAPATAVVVTTTTTAHSPLSSPPSPSPSSSSLLQQPPPSLARRVLTLPDFVPTRLTPMCATTTSSSTPLHLSAPHRRHNNVDNDKNDDACDVMTTAKKSSAKDEAAAQVRLATQRVLQRVQELQRDMQRSAAASAAGNAVDVVPATHTAMAVPQHSRDSSSNSTTLDDDDDDDDDDEHTHAARQRRRPRRQDVHMPLANSNSNNNKLSARPRRLADLRARRRPAGHVA